MRVQGSQGEGGAAMVPPLPLSPVAWTFNPYVNIQLFLMFFVYFFLLTQATFGISRLTGDPIRDPQVTTVPLPVRNIGGVVLVHIDRKAKIDRPL